MAKSHVKKGDSVKVLAGNDKGKTGTVTSVIYTKNRALVEGINMVTKHKKPSAANPQGGIVKEEAPIHISNLMVVDTNGTASRTGRKSDESGKTVRYSKKTGEVI